VEDGTLDRGRILQSSLDALQRDLRAYRAAWFSALYRSLTPTVEEARGQQAALRALLRSQSTATVSLAARMLRELAAADLLEDGEIGALRPGLQVPTKGPAQDIIRVLDAVRRRRPDLAPMVADVATAGLSHTDQAVQRAAANLLKALGAGDSLVAASGGLAPAVRADLGLLPESAGQTQTPTSPVVQISGCAPICSHAIRETDGRARGAGSRTVWSRAGL